MKSKRATNKSTPSTKKYVPIAEVRNDCVVLKDGTLRAVVMVASINFALKSSDEQQAIVTAYMSFLNSIDFPIQIVIQSRRFDIDDYLDRLKKFEKEQINELLKMQIKDYRNFVAELVKIGDIMTKKFYIVVPYNPLSDKQRGFWSRLLELFTPTSLIKLGEERFNQRRRDLYQRVSHVIGGLNSMGLQATPLDTQSLIELYYNSYNPQLSESEKMIEVDKIKVEE
ncbi:MAG: hypothetical protein WC480_02130 [Patescibacteria group bacterium]